MCNHHRTGYVTAEKIAEKMQESQCAEFFMRKCKLVTSPVQGYSPPQVLLGSSFLSSPQAPACLKTPFHSRGLANHNCSFTICKSWPWPGTQSWRFNGIFRFESISADGVRSQIRKAKYVFISISINQASHSIFNSLTAWFSIYLKVVAAKRQAKIYANIVKFDRMTHTQVLLHKKITKIKTFEWNLLFPE